MAATASFVPSGTPVTVNLQGGVSTSVTLPAPDPSNLDMTLTNGGAGPCHLVFGGTVPLTGESAGTVRVPGGAQVLLTANATVLKLLAANPLVITSPQVPTAQTATTALAWSGSGCVLTLQRGTAGANSNWNG